MKTGSAGKGIRFAVLFALSLAVLAGAPMVGMKTLPLSAVLHPESGTLESNIFWMIRVPGCLFPFLPARRWR